jgi:hypothetical protein
MGSSQSTPQPQQKTWWSSLFGSRTITAAPATAPAQAPVPASSSTQAKPTVGGSRKNRKSGKKGGKNKTSSKK